MPLSTKLFRRKSARKNGVISSDEGAEGARNEELSRGQLDLFELLEKLQTNRLDDQRCALPSALREPYSMAENENGSIIVRTDQAASTARNDLEHLRMVLKEGSKGTTPYPMVVLPLSGGYYIDHDDGISWKQYLNFDMDGNKILLDTTTDGCSLLELDTNAELYRNFFYNTEHYNFVSNDPNVGPVIVSLKFDCYENQDVLHIIMRKQWDMITETVPMKFENEEFQLFQITKELCEDIVSEKLSPVVFPKASDLIMAFDEHVLVNKMKFGIVYQKFGQTTEEQMFGNETHSPAMEEFLQMLGDKICLKGFTGFRGGLDTEDSLTGEHSYYTHFEIVDIMFHVSTLLPYSEKDLQQVQRKRHIGNDVVCIIFQDENTPFMPNMIASHFLHSFIVVQAVNPLTPNASYKVSVTCRDDVPSFGPPLSSTVSYPKSAEFRTLLLSKVINAELASLKAKRFSSLEKRTRSSLLLALHDTLLERTADFCGLNEVEEPESAAYGFFDSVRKILSGRPRSHAVESSSHTTPKRSSSRASNSSHGAAAEESTPSTSRGHPKRLEFSTTSSPFNSLLRLGRRIHGNADASSSTPAPNPQMLQVRACESDSLSMNSVEMDRLTVPEESQSSSNENVDSLNRNSSQLSLSHSFNEALRCAEEVRANGGMSDVELEITKLKLEKLNLLKEILACQNKVKRLKASECRLTADLNKSKQENIRLSAALARHQNMQDSIV